MGVRASKYVFWVSEVFLGGIRYGNPGGSHLSYECYLREIWPQEKSKALGGLWSVWRLKKLKKWKERGALVFYGSKCFKKWSNVKNPKWGKIHHGVKNLKMAIFWKCKISMNFWDFFDRPDDFLDNSGVTNQMVAISARFEAGNPFKMTNRKSDQKN